ncbi:MAG: methyltransferase domain-containing protein [Chloroflexi bacterium]|nr:methyltransferase domain-containing protein [Chloroflexota bacterium]
MVKPTDNSINEPSRSLSPPTGEGVVIDIGTGDGLFVYQSARQNPQKFHIGIDANPRPLEEISEKIHRKPAKGGLPNVLFIHAAVEALPAELDGVADEVHIHFPWGSLLRAVATGDETALRSLRRICASEAMLEIIIGLDPERDQSEIASLGLTPLTPEFLEMTLVPSYEAVGFEVSERGILAASEWPKLKTSWAKRLQGNTGRALIYLIARAIEVQT